MEEIIQKYIDSEKKIIDFFVNYEIPFSVPQDKNIKNVFPIVYIDIFYYIMKSVENFYISNNNFDEGHSFEHSLIVTLNCIQAILSNKLKPNLETTFCVLVACICHDLDDHKFNNVENNEEEEYNRNDLKNKNFIKIMEKTSESFPLYSLFIRDIKNESKIMINLVSCSENGIFENIEINPFYYFPRHADRLEALGKIGMIRCYQYNTYINRKIYSNTINNEPHVVPLPITKEELESFVTKERFDNYIKNKSNGTMLDHYYDKIFFMSKIKTGNFYFDKEYEKRRNFMIKHILKINKKILDGIKAEDSLPSFLKEL